MGQDPSEIREEIEQTRGEMGETVEALGYKADVKTRAKENIADKRDRLKGKLTGTGSRVGESTPDAEQVKQSAKRAAGVAQENPIGLALGSVAVGFVADDVKERAKETGQETLERGKEVAQEAAQTAKETAQRSGQKQAEELRGSAQEKAQQAKQGAKETPPA